MTSPIRNWRVMFDIFSTVVMILLGSALVWQNSWQSSSRSRRAAAAESLVPVPKDPIPVSADRILGGVGANVAVVTYSDFQCPYCAKAAREVFPVLIKEYVNKGRLKIAFKNLPLPIHPLAPAAAAAAECAAKQRQFWPMHDRLFSEPTRLLASDLRNAATEIGVDRTAFDYCLEATETAALIQQDKGEAARLGISGTPTFVFGKFDVDGRVRATDVLSGAKPVAAFREILERLLKT